MVKGKKKKDQVAKLTKMLKADGKEKISKERSRYGIIQNLTGFLEYLNGRKVRLIKGPRPELLYVVIQYPGYDGLTLAFDEHEIEITTKTKD